MSSITEFLDAPDSALLIANDGEIELVTRHHETATKLVIERFALGPVANVNAVLALLDLVKPLPALPPVVLPVPVAVTDPLQPALAAPVDPPPQTSVPCPECNARFKNASGLTSHQRAKHAAPVAPVSVYTGDVACSQCSRTFKSQHALDGHQARGHRANWSTKPKGVIPKAVAVEDVREPISVAPPVVLPPKPVNAAPVAGGICPVCHAPLVSHEECDICSVLIGSGHATQRSVFMTGLNLCQDCARTRIADRKTDLRTADLVPAAS